jgi:hypothetical protein
VVDGNDIEYLEGLLIDIKMVLEQYAPGHDALLEEITDTIKYLETVREAST